MDRLSPLSMLTGASGFAPHGTVSPPTGRQIPDRIASGEWLFFSLSTARNHVAKDEKSVLDGALLVPLRTRKSEENEARNVSSQAAFPCASCSFLRPVARFVAAGLCPLQDR